MEEHFPGSRNRKKILWIYIFFSLILSGLLAMFLAQKSSIEFRQKKIPEEKMGLSFSQKREHNLIPLAAVVLSPSSQPKELYIKACQTLCQAIEKTTGNRPALLETSAFPQGNLLFVGGPKDLSLGPEGFHIKSSALSSSLQIQLSGGSPLAEAYGIYYLSEKWLEGSASRDFFHQEKKTQPRLKIRMIEQGGVGLDLNPEKWGKDFSLHNREYSHIFLPQEPFLVEKKFQILKQEFKDYVHHIISYGYNTLVMVGFLEYLNFDRVGSGKEVYSEKSIYRKRHLVYREKFGELYEYAHSMGLKVILKTDMAPLTRPLENYFHRTYGKMDASSALFWEVYLKGMEELMNLFPSVDGLMIRIGEAGSMYNLEDWDYRSELLVRSVESCQKMLSSFLPLFEKRKKMLIFRTWSVGVGKIGRLHTHPEIYERVLSSMDSRALWVSTKYCKGDYFRYLSLNPTLVEGKHQRIIEFQTRREYEGFGGFPNFTGVLYQEALQAFLKKNPNIHGIWAWPQYGGPLHKSPMTAYPFHGLSTWIEANTWTLGKLAWNPDRSLSEILRPWISKKFGSHPLVEKNLIALLFSSAQAVKEGLYIRAFAEKELISFSIETPPLLWIFQWSWLSASPSALCAVHEGCRGQEREMVREGFRGAARVEEMEKLLMALKPHIQGSSEEYEKMIKSLAYEKSILTLLVWYRKIILDFYSYLENGDPQNYIDFQKSKDFFIHKKKEHQEQYGKDHLYPAYSVEEAEIWLHQQERNDLTLWASRAFFLCMGLFLLCAWWRRNLTSHSFSAITDRKKEIFLSAGILILCAFAFAIPLHVSAPLTIGIFLFLLLKNMLVTFFLLPPEKNRALPYLFLLLIFLCPLFPCLVRGADYFWYLFWTWGIFRGFCFGSAIGGILLFAGTFLYQSKKEGEGIILFGGKILVWTGMNIMVDGLVVGGIGMKNLFIYINREILLVPLPALEVLDFMAHLGISSSWPWYVVYAGLGLTLLGALIWKVEMESEGESI